MGVAIVGTISHIKQQTRMDYLLKEMILECVQLSLQPLPSKLLKAAKSQLYIVVVVLI